MGAVVDSAIENPSTNDAKLGHGNESLATGQLRPKFGKLFVRRFSDTLLSDDDVGVEEA